MNKVTIPMSTFINRTLEEIQGNEELGRAVVRTEALTVSDTTCTITPATAANESDVIEFGNELMLITGKTSDPTPIFTVSRGYYGTTAAAHAAGETGYLNPQWNRQRVLSAVRRAFSRMDGLGLPLTVTTLESPVEEVDGRRLVIEMPAECRSVLSVRDGLTELFGWEFLPDMNLDYYPTGRILRLPWGSTTDTYLNVTYRIPYRWSNWPADPIETSTIDVPEGAEDLPSTYAACWLISAREVSRGEIDTVAEWQQGEPQRGGISGALVRAKWQEFYRALDEARRLDPPRPRMAFVRRQRRGSW